METITREQLEEKIDGGEDFVLVDLGERNITGNHTFPAINLPLEEIERAEVVLPNKEAEIVVYCMNTMRPASEEAARELPARGYTNALDYEEGKRGPKTPAFRTTVTNSKGEITWGRRADIR